MTMNEYFERLTKELLDQNDALAYAQARTWVELLWEDFEATYARAGYSYKGKELTERVVRQWIRQYGAKLHEFKATNPKYKHLLNRDDYLKH
ncbi:WVELL family protein [Anoxybacillus sp. B7M1]|nr:WVELL family protein [Anoxybacillus sp. B2M1]ANB63184.1 WVELL family protein [Anoxybacillus sp. B7M1]